MGMKVEAVSFLIVAGLFVATTTGYWVFSHDLTGTIALGLVAGMAFLIGFYMYFTGRRIGARAEDNPDAEVDEGAGYYGFFAPYSWWPLWGAAAVALTGLGVAIAWWLALVGIGIVAMTTIGMVFEFYRGVHVH